jgi:hypothetical protein
MSHNPAVSNKESFSAFSAQKLGYKLNRQVGRGFFSTVYCKALEVLGSSLIICVFLFFL